MIFFATDEYFIHDIELQLVVILARRLQELFELMNTLKNTNQHSTFQEG